MQRTHERKFSLVANAIKAKLILLKRIIDKFLNTSEIELLAGIFVADAIDDCAHSLIRAFVGKAIFNADFHLLRRIVQSNPRAGQRWHSGLALPDVVAVA